MVFHRVLCQLPVLLPYFPNVSLAASYTLSSDPSMQFQNTAAVYICTCHPMHLSSHPVVLQAFCILDVPLALQAR